MSNSPILQEFCDVMTADIYFGILSAVPVAFKLMRHLHANVWLLQQVKVACGCCATL